MKNHKILSIILIFILFISLTSCEISPSGCEKIIIYSINDFHGAIEEEDGKYGAARISGYIKNDIAQNDDAATIVLSSGDMFQGSAISNHTKGEIVVDIMNEIGYDAMTIGNHEFDWGLETVLNYNDDDQSNGEANFPFLGCNIFDKRTNAIPVGVEPYVVIEEKGLKIGIVGYMGKGLETSIATAMVENYYFADPVTYVKKYTEILRTEEKCDVVIASGHDGDIFVNRQLAALYGNATIDAIINGHTHSRYSENYTRADGVKIPCIQSGTGGEYLGVTTLTIDPETKKVTDGLSFNRPMSSSINVDSTVKDMVDDIVTETAPVFKRELCTAGEDINQVVGCLWAADALLDYTKCDVAFINSGGIRNSAFPILKGERVTVSRVFEIMPFDNAIKTTMLKGKYIRGLLKSSGIVSSTNVSGSSNSDFCINGQLIEDEKLYLVAAVDYIFDQSQYPFQYGNDTIATGILFRDILINNLENIEKNGQQWLR
jgi:2',3'-cyclic-nucleotide 2'-phosphodiesterase (5'-nucleotidase family)